MLAGVCGVVFAAFTQLASSVLGRRAGLAFAAYGAGMILARLLVVPLARRIRSGIAWSFLVAAGGLAALAALPAPAAALAGPLLVAMGLAYQHPAVLALHVARYAPATRGRATATFYVGFDLGIGLGGSLLGIALGGLGPQVALGIASAGAAAGALVAVRVDPRMG
jgi:predicted MFS family arabinose efflux permease